MIDCIWWRGLRGNWDSGLLLETIEKHTDIFIQHNTEVAPQVERAIVIVVGFLNSNECEDLRKYLLTLKSGLVILTSEEDGFLDFKSAIPDHLETWTQYYCPAKKKIKERILLGVPNRFKDYDTSPLPKKYLWSFVGQVQNSFREKCVEVLKTLPDGYLHIADSFGGYGPEGMEYGRYLEIMRQSKFVFAVSGSMTADSFRLYESMELGAIPISNKRSPRDSANYNYWNEVYPQNTIITVNDWNEINLDFLTKKHYWTEDYAAERNGWWVNYKIQFEKKLLNIANQ